jgi:hypothetical protein
MTKIVPTIHMHRGVSALCAFAGALQLAACASTPPAPTAAIQAAEQAIAAADRTRVPDSVSPDLSEARAKLTSAQDAVQKQQMVAAQRLALESRVDAELASARIEADKAQAVNDEIKRSTATLMQEMQRNSGAKQ